MKTGNTVIVIPARMASERLPGKPMLMAGGKPLVQWTYERAIRAKVDIVYIATPDREIESYCEKIDMGCCRTCPDQLTGTLRVIETIEKIEPPVDTVVNWQVDEPLVEPGDVDRLIEFTRFTSGAIVTLVAPARDAAQLADPSVAKAAVSRGRAHWFSRAPMRGAVLHCGVYAFDARLIPLIETAGTTDLSRAESLEQLAWLEAGLYVRALGIERRPPSIDTPGDWERFKETIERN